MGVTFPSSPNIITKMAPWFWYAVVAAILYGAHKIFTRLAFDHIGDGLGGFVVESVAAMAILLYLSALGSLGDGNQKFSGAGVYYSVLTGICVGAGTVAFPIKTARRRVLRWPSRIPSSPLAVASATSRAGRVESTERLSQKWGRAPRKKS